MTKLTWLGHASWLIETTDHRILLDPYLTENPAAIATAEEFTDVTHVLVSHGHFDHLGEVKKIDQAGDVETIVKRNGSTLIAIFEIVQWFAKAHGIESAVGMNLGGSTTTSFGHVKLVPALHSSSFPDGSYAGHPAGFLLTIDNVRIYFACDTALFSDMRLYAHRVDVAVLPIGDLFTMGIDDSIAATKLIEPRLVLPTHYGTWPPIEQDAQAWAERIAGETNAKPVVLEVGGSVDL